MQGTEKPPDRQAWLAIGYQESAESGDANKLWHRCGTCTLLSYVNLRDRRPSPRLHLPNKEPCEQCGPIPAKTQKAGPAKNGQRAPRPTEAKVLTTFEELAEEHGGAMHDPADGAWYLWGDVGWQRRDGHIVEKMIRTLTGGTWGVVRNGLKQAAVLYRVREHVEEPDPLNPPGLVGFPDGTVWDGTEVRRATPDDRVTRRTRAAPAEDCTEWTKLVYEWVDGSVGSASALMETFGIALLGKTHRRFLVFHGAARSGKTTLLEGVSHAFGDYGRSVSSRLFLHDRDHETLIASVRGARMAWADEAPAGRRMNAERLKALTGGGSMSARFMRQDYFTFRPRALLVLACNSVPTLTVPDPALLDRMRVVPFRQSFDPDPEFIHRVHGLAGEIIRWCVDGWGASDGQAPKCQEWDAATDTYDAGQDLTAAIRDCFEWKGGPDWPRVTRSAVVKRVREWYQTNSSARCPHPREIHKTLRAVFPDVTETKIGGVRQYEGIERLP